MYVGSADGLAVPVNDEVPGVVEGSAQMRLVLARSDRETHGGRGSLVLAIDEAHVEVAVELAATEVGAVRSRVEDPVRALELTTALEALPEQFAIGVAGDATPMAASRASIDDVRELLARAVRDRQALWLGWLVPREVALAHAELLDEQLEDAVVALGSALTILAPPQTRQTSAAGALSARGGGSGRHESRRRDKRDASRAEDERRVVKHRGRERDKKHERDGEPTTEPDPRENEGAALLRTVRGASAKGAVRASVRRGSAVAGRTIEKGARVRVLDGPFLGKIGVVQELDGRGGARVMLGLLAVRVEVGDLARCAEGGSRPVLSTSHRKPLPVRS